MSRGIGEIMSDLDFDFEDIGSDQDFKGTRGLSYFVALRSVVELLADIRDDNHRAIEDGIEHGNKMLGILEEQNERLGKLEGSIQ